MLQYGFDHATPKIIDSELSKACRIITGTLQPTPHNNLYCLATIPAPRIQRDIVTWTEKFKQMLDPSQPLHGHTPVPSTLKFHKTFARVTPLQHYNSAAAQMEQRLDETKIPHLLPFQPHQKTLNKSPPLEGKIGAASTDPDVKLVEPRPIFKRGRWLPTQCVNVEERTRQWNTFWATALLVHPVMITTHLTGPNSGVKSYESLANVCWVFSDYNSWITIHVLCYK